MTHIWYSRSGMRRGLIIALAATWLWMGWAISWAMQALPHQNAIPELKLLPSSCSLCQQKISSKRI
jgi:hypothetical protein